MLVINRTMADRFFPDQEAIGAEIQVDAGYPARVVGVVGDVRTAGLAVEPRSTIYYAADQLAYNFMTVVLRTQGDPRRILPSVREEVSAMDPELPLHNVRTVDELLARNVGREAFTSRLLTGFALLALLLAAVGTYGVMASALERRRSELGIRLALGAEPRDAFLMIIKEGAKLVATGLGIGLLAAALLSRTVQAALFGVSTLDPWTYIATASILASVALGTVVITARRAAHTDPVESLRAD